MFIEKDVLLLIIAQSIVSVIAQQDVGFVRNGYSSNQPRSSSSNVKKSCRFTWEWESLIYGDLCLPSKSSLLPRVRSTSINRNKHRHKNKKSDGGNRHSRLYRRGDAPSNAGFDSGLLMESAPQYQMDAPKYLSMVSQYSYFHLTLLLLFTGSCRITWTTRSNGYYWWSSKSLFSLPFFLLLTTRWFMVVLFNP